MVAPTTGIMYNFITMSLIPRTKTLNELRKFSSESGGRVVFVRGRRRVGKTWLLQTLEGELKNRCFRLLCRKHRRDSTFLREITLSWCKWSNRSELSNLRSESLTWSILFNDIAQHAKQQQRSKIKANRSFVMIIDEIQWLSTDYEQSAGIIKAAWDEWSKDGLINLIICGSSSRFFTEQFGEGSPLRGIQTRSTLQVHPFSFSTIRKYVTPQWTLRESVLGYMCLGGIPYYWERVPAEKGFRRSMNEACCTNTTIMLEEWREIIATEFRTDAVENLSNLFPTLRSSDIGVTQQEITEVLGLSTTTVSRLLEKLVSYGYIIRRSPQSQQGASGATLRGARYMLSDFFLYFYFAALRPIENEIKNNESGLLFPYQILEGEAKEYIPTFTGKAFELFVHYHIDTALRAGEWESSSKRVSLYDKLDLVDANYTATWNVLVRGENSDKIISQIDLLVVHEGEKSVRVIECKWTNAGKLQDLEDVTAKILPGKYKDYTRKNILAVGYKPTAELYQAADKAGITIITLEDFL